MIIINDPKPSLDELMHYGVKGMRWGIRNEEDFTGYRLQGSAPTIDPNLASSTKASGKQISSLIGERYNFHISAVKAIGPDHPEYARGTIGFVQSTPGQRGGVIYAKNTDVRGELKAAEDIGWFAKGCGNPHAFISHEAAHAIFHAEQQVKPGFLKPKIVGGNIEARNKALKAALQEAKRSGISARKFSSKISGYAEASNMREEMEAELFSQYHWSPNPPQFVKVWGETLHHEMGIDDTPFRKVR